MMKEVTIEGILAVINEVKNLEVNNEQIESNLQEIGMDSITFIQIIVGLEEAFDCEIPDSKLLITEMDTVQKMIDVLQALYDEQYNL